MHKNGSITCGQAVQYLRTVLVTGASLWTTPARSAYGPVYDCTAYTANMPVFVLAFVHRFFDHLTVVTAQLMHRIHTTYKDQYKYKLRITL